MLGSGGSWVNSGGGGGGGGTKYVYTDRFEIIGSGTSGTVALPPSSQVVLDGFGGTVDAVITTSIGGSYTDDAALTSLGAVVATSFDTGGNYILSDTPSAYPVAIIYRVRQQLDDFDDTATNLVGTFQIQDPFSGTADRSTRTNSYGNLETLNNIEVFSNGFSDSDFSAQSTGLVQNNSIIRNNITLTATVDSPDESFTLYDNQANVDSTFDIGENTQFFRFHLNNMIVDNDKNVGHIEYIQNNFSIGNGTDPIESDGISYMMGFGTFNSGATIKGPVQGYGYQMNIQAGATFDPSTYSQGFYDAANFDVDMPGHTSFNAGPNIDTIISAHGYQGLTVNANISTIQTGAAVTGVNVGGSYGTFEGSSYWQGVNVNPIISSGQYCVGLYVTMDNVTNFAGVAASIVIQDLTIAADTPSAFGNTASIEYVDDGTGGAETVSQAGLAFTVHMEDGVSTAQNIADALNATVGFTSNFNVTISGTASNTQVAQAATNLAGGEDPGRKQAAYFDGDVEVTGALTFGGALSIGQLNAFYSQAMVDSGGNPTSGHSMITAPTVADNVTLTTADYLGVNTAMLLTIGNNATVGTAFVGISALGLPAVISMGTGSTVDQVAGATFAVSLDATAAGGTVDRLDLCRSIAIPNGVTAINNLRGYKFDLPFGDPGTKTHGFYEQPGVNNYFAGNLLIGGTPLSDDTVTNSSVALEIKSVTKAAVLSRMTTAERNALTAVNGMMVYNTTDDKFQGYAAGSWVDFH